jgi:hypothetical protein
MRRLQHEAGRRDQYRRDAGRHGRWLFCVAGALLVAGCDAPRAWNDYLASGYYRGQNASVLSLSVPAEVTGTAGSISTDELRSVVAEQMHVPTTARNAGAAPQSGSSTPDAAPTRIDWSFSGTPTGGGAETDVHATARYYSDNVLISAAEGTAVITSGRDPRLGELVKNVASQLFPTTPRGGPGRG